MSKDVLYIGTTTLDYIFPNGIGIVSGSGARGAIAAAIAQPENINISLATTLGSGDPFQDKVRALMEGMEIQVFSQPHANVPISIYDDGYGKKPSRQFKNEDFVYEPHKANGIDALTPDSTVFAGGAMARQSTTMQDFARELSAKGSCIILDVNSRTHVSQEISKAWAEVANIVKLARVDIPHMMDGNTDIENAAHTFLKWGNKTEQGTKIVCVTMDGEGTRAFWSRDGKIFDVMVPTTENLDVADEIGAGDAFDGGIAIACAELGITSENIGSRLDKETVEQIVRRGNNLATEVLRANNGPENKRPEIFKSLTDSRSLDEIAQSIYPPKRNINTSKESQSREI